MFGWHLLLFVYELLVALILKASGHNLMRVLMIRTKVAGYWHQTSLSFWAENQ